MATPHIQSRPGGGVIPWQGKGATPERMATRVKGHAEAREDKAWKAFCKEREPPPPGSRGRPGLYLIKGRFTLELSHYKPTQNDCQATQKHSILCLAADQRPLVSETFAPARPSPRSTNKPARVNTHSPCHLVCVGWNGLMSLLRLRRVGSPWGEFCGSCFVK